MVDFGITLRRRPLLGTWEHMVPFLGLPAAFWRGHSRASKILSAFRKPVEGEQKGSEPAEILPQADCIKIINKLEKIVPII
jgi:hypothetical protein